MRLSIAATNVCDLLNEIRWRERSLACSLVKITIIINEHTEKPHTVNSVSHHCHWHCPPTHRPNNRLRYQKIIQANCQGQNVTFSVLFPFFQMLATVEPFLDREPRLHLNPQQRQDQTSHSKPSSVHPNTPLGIVSTEPHASR
jgi:hypothetical protein